MSKLLSSLLAGCATLALSGASLAEDRSTRTEPAQEQNQSDDAGPANAEADSQGEQEVGSADQVEQAATDGEQANVILIVVPNDQDDEVSAELDDQDDDAAIDSDDPDVVGIIVPDDPDGNAPVETDTSAPAAQGDNPTER